MLEAVDQAGTHGVLGSEEEGEDDHGHLVIGEVLAALVRWLLHGTHPVVEHALGLLARGHRDLTLGSGGNKMLHRSLAALDCAVNLGAREREREVDQLESQGDVPVLLGDLARTGVVDVVAAEYPQGSDHVEVAAGKHDWLRRGVGGMLLEPLVEELPGNLVLDRDIDTTITRSATFWM